MMDPKGFSAEKDTQPVPVEGPVPTVSRAVIRNALANLGPGGRITHRMGTHFHYCLGLAVSPDGSKMLTANGDRTARLWDIASGQCLMVFEGHAGELRRAAFMNDGVRAVTTADDGTVRLWDCARGDCILVLKGHTGRVIAVAVSPDDRYIISSGDEGTLRVWSLPSAECKHVKMPTGWINNVLVTEDGKTLFTQSSTEILRWDLPGIGNPFRISNGHFSYYFRDIALAGDGELVAAAWDGLHCFDILAGVRNRFFYFKPLNPDMVVLTPDRARFIMCGAFNHIVVIVDRRTGAIEKELTGHGNAVTGMALSPDGRTLCTASLDRTYRIWDISTGECLRTIMSVRRVRHLFFLNNGRSLGTLDSGGAAKTWDLVDGSLQTVIPDVSSIAVLFLPNLVATGHSDGGLRLWDIRNGKEEPEAVIKAHKYQVKRLMPVRSGALLATCGLDGMRLWDTEKRDCVRTFPELRLVMTIAVDKDTEQVAAGTMWEDRIHLYDLASGDRIAVLAGHKWSATTEKRVPIRGLHFVASGKGLVSCGRDGRVILWDLSTGEAARSIEKPGCEILSMAVEQDERHLVIATYDGSVERWDLESEQRQVLWPGEGRPALSVVLSPDERRVFASFVDGTVRIIERESAALICTLWNVDDGFLWSVPPDEQAQDGWVWTNRDDLLHVIEEDGAGKVLGAVPLSDDRRRAYMRTRNNAAMVQARFKSIGEYARAAGRYAGVLGTARGGAGTGPWPAALPAQRKGDRK